MLEIVVAQVHLGGKPGKHDAVVVIFPQEIGHIFKVFRSGDVAAHPLQRDAQLQQPGPEHFPVAAALERGLLQHGHGQPEHGAVGVGGHRDGGGPVPVKTKT